MGAIKEDSQRPITRLGKSAQESVAAATEVDVTFDVEHFDDLGMHTGSEAIVTVRRTGRYRVTGKVDLYTGPNAGICRLYLKSGGAYSAATNMQATVANAELSLILNTTIYATAGATYRLVAVMNTSTPCYIRGNAQNTNACEFTWEYLD